jgi:hypothetical protein
MKNNGVTVERKEIRLQYAGYVVFAAKLLGVATGLIFQFMVLRQIQDTPEFGIWFNMSDMLAYFTLMSGVVPFWVMRCVARGKEGATKTGLATNLIFSAISTAAYLAIIPLILPWLLSSSRIADPYVYLPLYLLVSLQIVETYLMGLFEPCLQAVTPQSVGYGLLLQQVFKVVIGYLLIMQFGLGLAGAIVATTIAFAIQIVYYLKLTFIELRQRIQWGYVKEWLKGSVLSIYSVAGGQIANFVLILLFNLGGGDSRGIYGTAALIANVITHSSFLSFALYPKLLAEKNGEDVTVSLKTVLMFAIPMTVGAIALSNSYIILLTPYLVAYPGASLVLVVLAIDALVTVVSGIYGSVLFGVDTVDREKLSFGGLARSKLFAFYTLSYVHSAITIPTTYFVLTTYAYQSPLVAAFSVCLINSIVRFAMFIILVIMVGRVMKINMPWRSIAKYSLASAIMGLVLVLLPYSSRISTTLAWTAVGGTVYLAVLLLIDKETRSLPKSILQEVRKKNNGSKKVPTNDG